MYDYCFSWIVEQVNKTMHTDECAINLGPLTTALLEEVGRVRERFIQLNAELRAARGGTKR
jgi:hypothetical protein